MSWEIEVKGRWGNQHNIPEWTLSPMVSLTAKGVVINAKAVETFGLKLGTVVVIMTNLAEQKIGIKVAQTDHEINSGYTIVANGGASKKKDRSNSSVLLPCKTVMTKIGGIKTRRLRSPQFNQSMRIIEISYAPTEAEIEADLQWGIEEERKSKASTEKEASGGQSDA